MMARACTSDELAKLRADGQHSELYLAVLKPATVFACQLSATPDSTDSVVELAYDTVTTGAYTDVLPGMTCYVGSSAGDYDKGMVRIRKAADGTYLYIGETSDVDFAADDYLTVVDEFGIWPKHIYGAGDIWYMDYDIAYSDQHAQRDPIVRMGPIAAVLWLTGSTVSFSPSCADSSGNSSAIASILWTATGASATADLTTSSPTFTFNSPGIYRVDCTITNVDGKSTTGYRYVFVYSAASMPLTQFKWQSAIGDLEAGDWSASIELYDEALTSEIRDRALVVLFSIDHYGDEIISLGPIAGYENQILTGWIDGESIDYQAEYGTVTFDVQGPAFWMKNMYGFPVGLADTTSTPTDWLHMQALTVDLSVWHFLHWRSTVDTIMDVFLSGDMRRSSATEASAGSIWNQLQSMAAPILAQPLVNRFGQIYVEVETNLTPVADRTAIPIVQAITSEDWQGQIKIEKRVRPQYGMLEASGTSWDGTTGLPFFSRSGGRVMRLFGSIETRDRLLLSDQDDCNAQAGLLSAKANNPYPNIDIDLAENNRMVDICPRQYVSLTVTAAENPRGISWTEKRLVPKRVEFGYEDGVISTNLECEAETTPELSTTYIPPASTYSDITVPDMPDFPDFPQPHTNFPPVVPSNPLDDCASDPNPVGNYRSASATWDDDLGSYFLYFPCLIRGSVTNRTYLQFNTAASGLHVYAIDSSKNRILEATVSGSNPTTARFEPASATAVAGFEITGSGILNYNDWDVEATIAGGAVDATNSTGQSISGLTVGKFYRMRGTTAWILSPYGNVPLTHFHMAHGSNGWSGSAWYAGTDVPSDASFPEMNVAWALKTECYANCAGTARLKYYQVFFVAEAATVSIRAADDYYDDNSGSLGYVLDNVKPSPYALTGLLVANVCAA